MMFATTKEGCDQLVAHQHRAVAKANIMRLLDELDGMALTYEFDKLIALYGGDELESAIDELITDRCIYIVRKRE